MKRQSKVLSIKETTVLFLLIIILALFGINYYRKYLKATADIDKQIGVIQITEVLFTEVINSKPDFYPYTNKSDLLSLLEKGDLKIDSTKKNYHYFATNTSFAVANLFV